MITADPLELPPMPLTDTSLRAVKPSKNTVKLFDGGGLYLEVAPSGGRWWRLKYRFEGKEKRISLGIYPTVGLKEARERREQAKKLLSQGIDPSVDRKESKAAAIAGHREKENTFQAVALEWFNSYAPDLTEKHAFNPGYLSTLSFNDPDFPGEDRVEL